MIAEKKLGKFCEALFSTDSLKLAYADFHDHCIVNVPWKSCPYPKGRNEVKGFYIQDLDQNLPPYLPGGEKWQFQIRYLKDEEEIGGYNFFVLVRSEKSLLDG